MATVVESTHRFAVADPDGNVIAEADDQDGADLALRTLEDEGHESLAIVEFSQR